MSWLPILDGSLPWNLVFAQAPAPAPDVELLQSQLEFMKYTNTAFLGFLAFLGGLLTWFFKSNLEDAKKMAREMVRQELTQQLTPLVEAEMQHVVRSLQVERVIGDTVVDYYVVSTSEEKPLEYHLLKGRGFLDIRFWNEDRRPRGRLGSVFILDFVHSDVLNLPDLTSNNEETRRQAYQRREAIVNRKIQEVAELRLGRPIIIIYIRPGTGRIEAIDHISKNFPEVKYYASANTPVTLMGIAVDSAYVAYGDRATF